VPSYYGGGEDEIRVGGEKDGECTSETRVVRKVAGALA
jgi:hypothetical protein